MEVKAESFWHNYKNALEVRIVISEFTKLSEQITRELQLAVADSVHAQMTARIIEKHADNLEAEAMKKINPSVIANMGIAEIAGRLSTKIFNLLTPDVKK